MKHFYIVILFLSFAINGNSQSDVQTYFHSISGIIDSLRNVRNKDALSFLAAEVRSFQANDFAGKSFMPIYSIYKHKNVDDALCAVAPNWFFFYFEPIDDIRISSVITYNNHEFDHLSFERDIIYDSYDTVSTQHFKVLADMILSVQPDFVTVFGNCYELVFLVKGNHITICHSEAPNGVHGGNRTYNWYIGGEYKIIDTDELMRIIQEQGYIERFMDDYGYNEMVISGRRIKEEKKLIKRNKKLYQGTPMEIGRNLLAKPK